MCILQTRTIIQIHTFFLINTIVFAQNWPNYVELLKRHRKISEDGRLDFIGLADKYGHTAEEHYVITHDGYNLTLFHIPGCEDTKNKSVLLVHGNTVDPDCFIIRGKTSLAITLADKCYDVWVISMRGTIYSQRHVTIDPVKEPQLFFDFSFYEMGIYDLPATIDYVLKATKEKQVLTIGYSIGTTTHLVMGSEKPSYNGKIKAFLALAPFCYTKHIKGYTRSGFNIDSIVSPFASSELVGRNQLFTYLVQSYCLDEHNYDVCVKKGLFSTFGQDASGLEPGFMSTLFGHFPAGSSKKMVQHNVQIHFSDKFAKYNYGLFKNLDLYGSVRPPKIDLSKMTMRVALFVGNKDYLATEKDVERLAGELPNVVYHQVMPYANFSHLDFVYGRYMPDNLYPYLFKVIEKYI